MSPNRVGPAAVAVATVRRLSDDGPAQGLPVQRVAVPVVPAPQVLPRQVDHLAERLTALQQENAQLRAELEQVRRAG